MRMMMRHRGMDTPATPFGHVQRPTAAPEAAQTRALEQEAKDILILRAEDVKNGFIEFLTSQGVDAFYVERVEQSIDSTTLVNWLDGGLDLLIKNI